MSSVQYLGEQAVWRGGPEKSLWLRRADPQAGMMWTWRLIVEVCYEKRFNLSIFAFALIVYVIVCNDTWFIEKINEYEYEYEYV